eukprot:PITA_17212
MKVERATFILKGKVDIWWEDVKNVKGIHEEDLTWNAFGRLFKENYFFERYYNDKSKEFYELRMCSMTKDEYTSRFFEALRPFKILEKIGQVAYQLALPPIVKFHHVFHISLLKKFIKDVDHVIDWYVLKVKQEGELQLEPHCILQQKHLMLRNRAIEQVKVQWKQCGPEESTWEMEDQMRALYPSLFGG